MEHYIREGADHIYLIDNNSTDSCGMHISDMVEKGIVTVIWDPTRHFQVELPSSTCENCCTEAAAECLAIYTTACIFTSGCKLHTGLL